jgi:MFS family permease
MSTTLRRFSTSLRYRDNRVFWYGTSLSSVGQGAFVVAASWLAYELGGSGAVGIVTFATMIPFILATPIGGLLADRTDRRTIILACQTVQCSMALILALQSLFMEIPFPELALLVFITGMSRAVELPTTAAVLPNLVPREALLNSFSLNSLATLGARFTGPVIILPLLAIGGATSAFFVVAAVYVPAYLLTRRVPPQRATGIVAVTFAEQVGEGVRYVREHASVALLLGIVMLHCGLTMSFDSTLPLFAEDNLDGSGAVYSAIVAAVGLGSIVGTLYLAGLRSTTRRGTLLFASAIGGGTFPILLAIANVVPVALAVLFALGATQAIFMTLCFTLVQESAPDHLRGRANGIMLMAAGGIMSFTNLGNGYLADRFGVVPVLGIPALIFLGAIVLLSLGRPALRRIYRDGALPGEAYGGAAVTAGD